jgi:hypothetical protein
LLLEGTLANTDLRLSSVANPLGVFPPASAVDDLLSSVSFLLLFACIVGCCVSVVARFRRAAGLERQQLKWLAYAALWAALAFLVVIVGVYTNNTILASSVTFNLLLLGIPVAVGIAILRHRLFDIDLIINRTLVYGSLTAILATVYFGVVIGLQALVQALTGQTKPQPVVIVLSTLLIAALFTPLRWRIQAGIDRRFYRAQYDAVRTLEQFAVTLRGELNLAELNAHLVGVVEETMQPAQVSLWLRQPMSSSSHGGPLSEGR